MFILERAPVVKGPVNDSQKVTREQLLERDVKFIISSRSRFETVIDY